MFVRYRAFTIDISQAVKKPGLKQLSAHKSAKKTAAQENCKPKCMDEKRSIACSVCDTLPSKKIIAMNKM